MINRYIVAATIAILLVVLSYVYNFYYILNYSISTDTAVWGQLGDYTGGLLNPVLSFISLVLLIKSLTIQNEANSALRKELKNNEKTEKLRAFETQFFNMLNSQKKSFDLFKVEITSKSITTEVFGAEAVLEIEETMESLKKKKAAEKKKKEVLESIDWNDQLFGVTRRFYVMVKMISEKLSAENGFSAGERHSHFITLINFTDFPLLRLIMMSMQFMDYESTRYLKQNEEFNTALKEVKINYNIY